SVSCSASAPRRDSRAFPTRRSSDLQRLGVGLARQDRAEVLLRLLEGRRIEPHHPRRRRRDGVARRIVLGLGRHAEGPLVAEEDRDRKSTRLNSSHVKISYAVFCLKK